MKLQLLFVALTLVACERATEESPATSGVKQYAFFTWAHSGQLCFALMTESESHKFIHRWFPRRNGKCGVGELKEALANLPKDSYVYWVSWPPKGFGYPSDHTVDDVTQFAKSQGLHFELSPALE